MDVDVIAAKLDALDRRSDERHQETLRRLSTQDSTLARVERQCNATNGRVTKLETIVEAENKWPSLRIWLAIVGGTLAGAWFLVTQVLQWGPTP